MYKWTLKYWTPECCLFLHFFRGPVASKKEAKEVATFTALRGRKRNIVVNFLSDELAGVRGECAVDVN